MLSIIAAVAENNIIGKEQSLAWRLPDDLKRFKGRTLTGSKTMIMGRKTFESLPQVLPGRKHIILTQNKNYQTDDENTEIIHSIAEVMPYVHSEEEYFVIGGGQIFRLLLPYTQKMYLTRIHASFEGDTFFPSYDQSQWRVTAQEEGIVDEENQYSHTFLIFERI